MPPLDPPLVCQNHSEIGRHDATGNRGTWVHYLSIFTVSVGKSLPFTFTDRSRSIKFATVGLTLPTRVRKRLNGTINAKSSKKSLFTFRQEV